jgi:hypothetical protein
MTATLPASATHGASFYPAVPATSVAASSSDIDVLPAPSGVDRAKLEDAMTMLYLLLNARSSAAMSSAQGQILSRQAAKDEAFKEQLEALRRAAEAEGEGSKGFFASFVDLVKDAVVNLVTLDVVGAITDPLNDIKDMWNSPKFWQDLEAGASFIAKAALIAGGIAATVATAGSAGPLVAGVALALSAAGTAIQETDCLDGLLGDGASDWIGAGMQLAAGVICLASAGSNASSWINTVATAGQAGGGAALIVTGGAHARAAKFEGDVVDAEADAKAARQRSERMTRLVEWLIDGIQATEASHERAKESLGLAIQQHDQAQLSAIFTTGRQLS